MRRIHRGLAVMLVLAGLQVSGCSQKADTPSQIKPSKVEQIPGTDLKRVTLSQKSAARLDITVIPVSDEQPASRKRVAGETVVPYGAVLYDAKGKTWVYINPEPLVFVRHPVSVGYIDGDRAVLSAGPALGTTVVTVGVAELFGAENAGK